MNARFRLVFLPPEVTKYLFGRVQLTDWRGNDAFRLRLVEMEGFESPALAEPPEDKWDYRAMPVSEKEAHSGRKSFVVSGRRRVRIDPSPVLEPNGTYKLEAWVKVVGEGGEVFLVAQPAEWLPRGRKIEPRRSATVRDGEGWKCVSLAFTNGPLGSTAWLFAAANGGTAYFDDLHMVKIAPDTQGLRGESE